MKNIPPKKLKTHYPEIVFSITLNFMFFIFEPINMYAYNIDDFWFDFYILIWPNSIAFIIGFVILTFILIITKKVFSKFKKKNLYQKLLTFAFFVLFCIYIHGNFLTSFLPKLDGTLIDWNQLMPNIISVVICVVFFLGYIIYIAKISYSKILKYPSYISLGIIGILCVSLLSTFLTMPVFEKKEVFAISTIKNLTTISKEENFFILLLDAVSSPSFDEIVNYKAEYKKSLKDFSYFKDTLSGYGFTRDSIPFIFSGQWNNNEQAFSEYSTEAYNNSTFFAELEKQHYNKNFYDYDFVWRDEKSLAFDNIKASGQKIIYKNLIHQEIKYILYKYLPFPLKKFSQIETMTYKWTQDLGNEGWYEWGEINFNNNVLGQPANYTEEKMFKFIHLDGAHVPYETDENLTYIPEENGTYEQEVEASIKLTQNFIEYLKRNKIYNNSTIVIMSDHGIGDYRQNPILLIKGKNETHHQMKVSEKQISYADLCDNFIELTHNRKSTDIFINIPTRGRTRRYLYNGFNQEDRMYEYEQTGKAWELDTFMPTGKEFILK